MVNGDIDSDDCFDGIYWNHLLALSISALHVTVAVATCQVFTKQKTNPQKKLDPAKTNWLDPTQTYFLDVGISMCTKEAELQ